MIISDKYYVGPIFLCSIPFPIRDKYSFGVLCDGVVHSTLNAETAAKGLQSANQDEIHYKCTSSPSPQSPNATVPHRD